MTSICISKFDYVLPYILKWKHNHSTLKKMMIILRSIIIVYTFYLVSSDYGFGVCFMA